jgi:hypothetical protein
MKGKFFFLAAFLFSTSCASLASIPLNDVESYIAVPEHVATETCASCHAATKPYPTQQVISGEAAIMDIVARKRTTLHSINRKSITQKRR